MRSALSLGEGPLRASGAKARHASLSFHVGWRPFAGVLLLAFAGCSAVDQRTVSPCAALKPGQAMIMNVRPDDSGVFGIKSLAWPWISQQSLFAKRTEQGVCTVETEAPSTSSLVSTLESPIETGLSKVTIPVW